MSGEIRAVDGRANVFAYQDLSAPVTAGDKAEINTWASVSGAVQAGAEAEVFARNDVTAAVTAEEDVDLFAGGNVTGNVTAGGVDNDDDDDRREQDTSSLVRDAIDELKQKLTRQQLEESADLYAELYAEDGELQSLTEQATEDWPE